jgi:hypothetical protein
MPAHEPPAAIRAGSTAAGSTRVSLHRNPRHVVRTPMDETLIYVKTPKGSAEVGLRVGGLSLQARRILIMIDGARTLGELTPLVPGGTLEEVIGLLQARGMIRRSGEEQEEEPPPTALSSGADTMQSAVATTRQPLAGPNTGGAPSDGRLYLTVDEVKRRAVHELNEQLGPDASSIAVRIERSTNADELRELLRESERLVARMVGEGAAQKFVRAMRRRN